MDLKPHGGRAREQGDASPEGKEEKPGLGALEGLEFKHCPGLADTEGNGLSLQLPPSLFIHCKGCMETANTSPVERNLISIWKEMW